MLPNATPYHFGILCSTMHNAFMRTVAGRLKSDYRYSNTIVYNNFPFPFAPQSEGRPAPAAEQKHRAAIETAVKHPKRILTVRGVGYVFARQQD